MYPKHLPTFHNTLSHMLHLDCIHACMVVSPPPSPQMVCFCFPHRPASGLKLPDETSSLDLSKYGQTR